MSTKGNESKKTRCFLLTIFSRQLKEFTEFIQTLPIKRATYQLEACPTTQKEHIQAFIEFEEGISYNKLKKYPILQGAHIEGARCPKHAQAYCSKEDTRIEGPFQVGPAYLIRKPTLKVIREYILNGNLEKIKEEFFGVYLRCRRAIIEEISLHRKVETTQTTRGIWISGDPGVGKTFTVRSMDEPIYTKSPNKWWDAYNGELIILADDWDEEQARWASHYLKIWTDKYPFIAECKGGSVRPSYHWFIITSNLKLHEFRSDYPNIKYGATKRRFLEIACNTPEGKPLFIDMFNL